MVHSTVACNGLQVVLVCSGFLRTRQLIRRMHADVLQTMYVTGDPAPGGSGRTIRTRVKPGAVPKSASGGGTVATVLQRGAPMRQHLRKCSSCPKKMSREGPPVGTPEPDRVLVAEGPRGGGGLQGTPTCILQNYRHVALIILRYAFWGQYSFVQKNVPCGGWVPGAGVGVGAQVLTQCFAIIFELSIQFCAF